MKRLCVIGDPIEHSKSPLIQNAMIAAAGLPCTYTARRVPGDQTAAWLAQARAEGFAGFNATMPHKEHLAALADELSEDARKFQSVNTVCIKNDKIYGYNTDGDGFLQALRQAGLDPAGKQVLVLGAGGAAKAVVPKLLEGKADGVFVANRTLERAAALCAWDPEGRMAPADFAPDTLKRLAARCELAVNCTSLGMTGTAGQFDDLSFLEELRPGGGVFDLIYSPARTPLLERAEALGLTASNGLGMLVWQGVFALERFVGERLDRPVLAAAARRALEDAP